MKMRKGGGASGVPKVPNAPKPYGWHTMLGTQFAKVVKFAHQHPKLTTAEIAKQMGLPKDTISNLISHAKAKGYALDVKQVRAPSGLKRKEVENKVVFALRNTLTPARQIARELRIHPTMVSEINVAYHCRAPLISHLLSHRYGLNWRKLPKRRKPFTTEQKWTILNAHLPAVEDHFMVLEPVSGKSMMVSISERGDLKNDLALEAFDALDHYSPELCTKRVFVLLVAQRALRYRGYAVREQKRLLVPIDELPYFLKEQVGK